MKKTLQIVAVLAVAFMVGACSMSMDTIKYAGTTDKPVQTGECVEVATIEEAAVEAAAPVVIKKIVKIKQPIMFPFDSAVITDNEMAKIDALANILDENPDTIIAISAFASSEGPEDYNLELSQGRANAVQSALIEKGISEDRIIDVIGKGETGIFGELLKLNRRAIVIDVE